MAKYKGLTGKKVSIKFVWYDLWIGVFIDTVKNKIYICPLPTIVILIEDKFPEWWKNK